MAPQGRVARVTYTDADGRYEFRDLPAGRYTLTAEKAGFVRLAFGQRRPFEPARPVDLADGQFLDQLDFLLPRGGVIAGRVVDEFGDPVAGVFVQALRARSTGGERPLQVAGSATTDDRGDYRIYGLPPGDYYVSAALRLWGGLAAVEPGETTGYAPTYFPGTPNPVEAQRLTVGIGQEVDRIDFALVPTRTVRVTGTIVDSQGRPVGGVPVLLRAARSPLGGFAGRHTGFARPDGSFIVAEVVPGDYVLRVATRPGVDGEREFAAVPLSVGHGDLSGVVITTSPGATLSGQVVLERGIETSLSPQALRVVLAPERPEPEGPLFSEPGRVRDDWTFTVRNVASGRYFVRLGGLPPDWALKAVVRDGADITDTPLEVNGADRVDGLRLIVTSRPTEVNGTAVDEHGRAVQDYVVLLFAEDRARWTNQSRYLRSGRSDQDGRFRVRGLPPEIYLAVAVESVAEDEWTDPAVLERLRPYGSRVILGEGDTKSVTVKLAPLP
jgi:protocatechuate 3,4-dioxygenase beta subunit